MYTSLDSITTELNKRLDEVETKIKAWKAVKRVTKKDGSDFAVLSKNFDGATLYDSNCHLYPSKKITVCGWTKYSGWITDDIHSTGTVAYEKNRTVSEDRIIKESMIQPYYYKTVDEIFEDIEHRIKFYEGEKAKYEADIANASKVFGTFKEKIDSALAEMKASCAGNGLYYLCRDYMHSAY